LFLRAQYSGKEGEMMKLKSWIDELETAEGEPESGAQIERQAARSEYYVHTIIRLAVSKIEMNLNGQQYKSSPETLRAEDRIDIIAKALLSGESSDFDELRAACAAWIEAARINPRALTAEQSTLPTGKGRGKP
jgi:hypothetical protein